MRKKLFVITLIAAMLAALSACGPKIPTPTETVDSFLTAVKAQDSESLAAVYSGGELDLLDEAAEADESGEAEETEEAEDTALAKVYEEEMLPKMLDFDYELSNEQVDGEKATVDVKITTYSFGEAFTAFTEDYLEQVFELIFSDVSEEELDALAGKILSGKLAELTEKNYVKTVTVPLSMKDGKWVVDELQTGGDLADGLTGGIASAFAHMDEAMSELEEEE